MEDRKKVYFIRLDCGADKSLIVSALEKLGGKIGAFEKMKLDELKPEDKNYNCIALFPGDSEDDQHILIGNTETIEQSSYEASELLFYPYYEEFHDEDWEILVESTTLPPIKTGVEGKMKFKFSSRSSTHDAYKMFAYAADNDMRGIFINDDTISVSEFAFNIRRIHDAHSSSISLKMLRCYRNNYDSAKEINDMYAHKETPVFVQQKDNVQTQETDGKTYQEWEDDAVKVDTSNTDTMDTMHTFKHWTEDDIYDADKRARDMFKKQLLGTGENEDSVSSKIFGNVIPDIQPAKEIMQLDKEGYYNIPSKFNVVIARSGKHPACDICEDVLGIQLIKRWSLKDAKPGDIIIFENDSIVGNKKIYVVFKSYEEFADSNNHGAIESEMWAYGFINYDDTLHAEEISYDSSYIKSMKHRPAKEWEVREFYKMLRDQYRKRWNNELLKFEDIIPDWLQEGEHPRYFTVKYKFERTLYNMYDGPFYVESVDFTNSEDDISLIEQGLAFKSSYEAEPYVKAQNESYKKINEEFLKK